MTNSTNTTDQRLQPVGADKNFVLKIMKLEDGLSALIVVTVETALFLVFLFGRSEIERLVGLGGFLTVILAVIVVQSIERRRAHIEKIREMELLPAKLTATPIKPGEADEQSDLAVAPDHTFVYAPPPAGWTIEITTIAAEIRKVVEGQAMGAIGFGEGMEPFRSGPLILFNAIGVHRIEYLPGRSAINGRPAFSVLDEDICEQVRMYSISKRGGMVRDMSWQHVFGHVLGGLIQGGFITETIRSAPREIAGRATLTALGVLRLSEVKIDGIETASASVEVRLHVVEYADFIYVIQTRLVSGLPSSDTRRAEIEEIVNSFRAAVAPDAADRARTDANEADAAFEKLMAAVADEVLFRKAGAVVASMRPNGSLLVTPKHIEQLEILAENARAFPRWIQGSRRAVLEQLVQHAKNAVGGDTAPLIEFLQSVDQAATAILGPAEAGTAPAAPGA